MESKMNIQKKIRQILSYKTISKITLITLVISLLPLLYCSFFDYATGDDLWEGAVAYHIIQSGGSVRELFEAVFAWMKADYIGWQGNWSSTFLWCFSPNVFGEKVYCITPWIGLVSICAGHWYCFKHFNQKYLGIKEEFFLILYAVITMLTIQYMPYIRGGIYWYSAMINYTFPYGLTMAIFVWLDKYLELGKRRYLIFQMLALSFLGGSGYLAIVLNFEVFVLTIVCQMFSKDKDRKKRVLHCLLPLLLLVIGFAISAMSPGNAVRGGESYGFSIGNIFYTLKECIVQGAIAIPATMWRVKLLVVVTPFIAIGVWENLKLEKCKINFRYPVIITVFLFLISCSVYAPGIYSGDELSGGVYDTLYFVFILFYFLVIIYIVGYMKQYKGKVEPDVKFGKKKVGIGQIRNIYVIVAVAICIIGTPVILNHSAYKVCVDFIVSGQLKDFEEQMQERLEILNDPIIEDVVLPEMNDQQGPFMHMPATGNPTDYVNQCIAHFYGKKSVICIPREEYYKLYGKEN